MLGVYVTVPIACFRKGLAREYLETELLPPPATCYGFLLSLVGETDRLAHVGCRVASVLLNKPLTSVVLRTVWRVKKKMVPLGSSGNARPDYQQLLTDVRLVVWVDSSGEAAGRLEDRVRTALTSPVSITRFGGLSLERAPMSSMKSACSIASRTDCRRAAAPSSSPRKADSRCPCGSITSARPVRAMPRVTLKNRLLSSRRLLGCHEFPPSNTMLQLPVSDSHRPPVRVMALHALAYCQRLFYLEEVEEIRVADHRVFAGRHLHAALEAGEEGESVSLELSSEPLGLLGKVDCLRRRDGSHLPYEHKRGRPARAPDNTPEAWPSDRIQLIAYAVLLEEAFDQPIPEGRIRYHAANVTVRVPINDRAKTDLRDAIADAQRLRETVVRPPITDNARLCENCSLAPVCLPEEVRQARDPEHDPLRLFPQDRDGTTLHVVAQSTVVGISGNSLVVKPRDGQDVKHPASGIDTLLLHGFTQVTTQAIRKCVEYGIGVHWLSASGYHIASLAPTAGQVQRRIRQYRALTAEDTCLRLAKQLASAKVEGQYRYLMRASRSNDEARAAIQLSLNGIKPLIAGIPAAGDRDSLRGLEGWAAVHYFAALRKLLGSQVHNDLRSDSRSRRPPQDRWNACLSYAVTACCTRPS